MMVLNNPIKDHKGSWGCVPRALRAQLKGFHVHDASAASVNAFLTAGKPQQLLFSL